MSNIALISAPLYHLGRDKHRNRSYMQCRIHLILQ